MGSIDGVSFWSGLLYNVIGVGAFGGGAVWALVKWGHRFTVRAAEESMEPRLKELRDSMNKVYAQLVPNGGSSQRDAVNRIEAAVVALTEKLTETSEAMERHLGYHDGMNDAR
jgi:hypothetical protein